jgi:hypothetical protein
MIRFVYALLCGFFAINALAVNGGAIHADEVKRELTPSERVRDGDLTGK